MIKSTSGSFRLSRLLVLPALTIACWFSNPVHAASFSGTVINEASGAPIGGAIVTLDKEQAVSDASGHVALSAAATILRIRAVGYRRAELDLAKSINTQQIKLTPLSPKALYLSIYGIGAASLREPALQVIETAGLNAVVIDMKGDSGLIPYPSEVALASGNSALRIRTVGNLGELVASLKNRGLYTIARIVVFKDNLLAAAHPAWAVHQGDGTLWKDPEGQSWIDPFRTDAWNYSIGIAAEAAASGFDEIQFDYVRFPDATGLRFAEASTQASRTAAIKGFLHAAKLRLQPYNVFLAVDVFGYTCWNRNDTNIGQRLEDMAPEVDYISPMLYPSGFQFGIPGYRNPMLSPHEIVYNSLQAARQRTMGYTVRFRPWLQAFKDYAFDQRRFGEVEIRAQVSAAEEAGADGWMLWNPRNVYSTEGLLRMQTDVRD
ncbi:MAG TPA: putative glycoside hydrolase [Dongiaceae bacterium]|nr:putative glycoside hydrolase [Dongiaceae bacterium]